LLLLLFHRSNIGTTLVPIGYNIILFILIVGHNNIIIIIVFVSAAEAIF